mmetsp:Transcript_3813/g.5991  ORF Transcript_3813/g.5991 Transcript_3813/m.5991 type:complete len:235 (+) Transcript_3813:134-838(+)|eukprot:jgi/Bigna1/92267/estExt_fgenesh1_pm.C_100022
MSESKGKRAFLDLDINGNRAAYARACAFVEATDLRHGWSSKDIKDLGGSEMSRLQEAYESDYDWKDKGRIIMTLPKERVVIELYEKDCPVATKNFKALCTGEKGKSGKSGNKLHYKGVRFHRIVKGFVCQGGDISKQTGAGGESIYGKKFKDEKNGLKKKFSEKGLIGMCNNGKNSNNSQFFFNFAPAPQLNGKHVILGKIVEGLDVIEMVEAECATEDGTPKLEVVVADCGLL